MRFLLVLTLLQGFAATIAAQNAQNAPSASTMLDASRAFLATLDPAQKSEAVFPFNSDEDSGGSTRPYPERAFPSRN